MSVPTSRLQSSNHAGFVMGSQTRFGVEVPLGNMKLRAALRHTFRMTEGNTHMIRLALRDCILYSASRISGSAFSRSAWCCRCCRTASCHAVLYANAAKHSNSSSASPLHGQQSCALLFAFLPGECAIRQEAVSVLNQQFWPPQA